MWSIDCLSTGELCSDDYLQVYDKELCDYIPKYPSMYEVDYQIEYINDCISRLQAEKEMLEKYGSSIVDKITWEDALNNPIDADREIKTFFHKRDI